MRSLLNKKEFLGLDNTVWLYSGAETPPLKGGIKEVNKYFKHKSEGELGRLKNEETEFKCKSNIADIVGSSASNIALISNASEAISVIIESLCLKSGDNIVINSLEFPSGVLPSLLQKKKGVEIRVVEHADWEVHSNDIISHVDSKTKLVLTSHVSYLSGFRIDYKRLYKKLSNTNALLLLDATQSLGAIEVDASYADFIVSSSYKWLLSAHGVGVVILGTRSRKKLIPNRAGWRSIENIFSKDRFKQFEFHKDARRLEVGFPSYPTIYNLEYSTKLLCKIGIENIEEHILELGSQLIKELDNLDIQLMTSKSSQQRAGNISIICKNAEKIAKILQQEKVYVWGGDNRLRISIHLFNDTPDIRKFVEKIQKNRNFL